MNRHQRQRRQRLKGRQGRSSLPSQPSLTVMSENVPTDLDHDDVNNGDNFAPVNNNESSLSYPSYHNSQSQRHLLHRRLFPALVWLSFVTAILVQEKSTLLLGDSSPSVVVGVRAEDGDDTQQQQKRQRQKQPQIENGDLIILEDGSSSFDDANGAVEVITDHNHHQYPLNDDQSDGNTRNSNSIPTDNSSTGNNDSGVIVAVAVDGTLAGISKRNGKVLWKKQPKEVNHQKGNPNHGSAAPPSVSPSSTPKTTSPLSSSSSTRTSSSSSSSPTLDNDADSLLMQPLVSTTTTTKSASSSKYAAVPSVDGTVFTTSNDMTVSSSVKDLVGRAPFLDPKGRFYVGSRHATAAALDGDTGEVLRVIATPSSSGSTTKSNSGNNKEDNETLPDLEGRNVVWIGRVDYVVSVQDARTGMVEAQFSVAEVMSVADMNGMTEKEAWKPDRLQPSSSSSSSSSESKDRRYGTGSSHVGGATNQAEQDIVQRLGLPASEDPFEALSASGSVIMSTSDDDDDNEGTVTPASVVATPNGNVGYWDYETDGLSWVADEVFDTPIAFAMDVDTGVPIKVDIIPDVPDPNADREDITREMERQLEISADDSSDEMDEQTIVGAMTNGQLFALPLGRKASKNTLPGRSTGSSFGPKATVPRASGAKTTGQLPGRTTTNTLPSEAHQHNQDAHALQHQSTNSPPLSARKSCDPSSSTFPGCLVKDRSDSNLNNHQSSSGGFNFIPKSSRGELRPTSDVPPPMGRGDRYNFIGSGQHGKRDPDNMALMNSHFHSEDGGFYHPEYGYWFPQDVHRAQFRNNQRKQRKGLWALLYFWSPALITGFVLAFELGRRKRQRDEKSSSVDSLKQDVSSAIVSKEVNAITNTSSSILDLSSVQESPARQPQQHVIKVSDEVLGYGGHGTVVYKGVLDGRDVAVKRMLKTYHASADREISLLIESDGDPNVVRYFLKEARGDFVYLALELCDLSLHDLVGILREKRQCITPEVPFDDSVVMKSTRRVLLQIASGVKHLHFQCRIVHRDLKPANILLAVSKRGKKKVKKDDPIFDTFLRDYYDAKISDMGLGKQLRGQSSLGASLVGESSYRGSTGGRGTSIGVGPGSVGWQAPEVMALRPTSDMSTRSNDSASNDMSALAETSTNPRTSRSVDIFSLGCIFYSVLIPGSHPFGEWFEREANIMHNKPNLSPLKEISMEAFHLINSMLERDPRLRPSAKGVCDHPFFWSSHKKLIFLCDVSDRIETECSSQSTANAQSLAIERGAMDVVGTSWESRLDDALVDNVNKFRTYDYACIRDLLRLIRNKHHHFDELPEHFRQSVVPDQDALLEYFEGKFPNLVMHCYNFCQQTIALKTDALLSKYEIVPTPKDQIKNEMKSSSIRPVAVVVKNDTSATREQETSGIDKVEPSDDNVTPNRSSVLVAAENSSQNEVTLSHEKTSADPSNDQETEETPSKDLASDIVMVDMDNDLDPELLTCIDENDIIVWEGSTAAKAFNCRGWSRSEDEWSRRIEPCYKKRDPALKRCIDDPKYRTRLCNHWDTSHGMECPMKRKGKCIFAHGPAELRVKEGKKNRWGKLVNKNGDNKNPFHSGGEDTFGAASSIEKVRKEEGKWNTSSKPAKTKNGASGSSSTQKPKRNNTSNASSKKNGPRNDMKGGNNSSQEADGTTNQTKISLAIEEDGQEDDAGRNDTPGETTVDTTSAEENPASE